MKSFFSYFSPYVRFLEFRVDELQKELEQVKKETRQEKLDAESSRNAILDRLVRLTTGFSVNEPMPNAMELQEKQTELANSRLTNFDLMRQAEAATLDLATELNESLEEPQEANEAPPDGLFMGPRPIPSNGQKSPSNTKSAVARMVSLD